MEALMLAPHMPLASPVTGSHHAVQLLFMRDEAEIAQAARTDACILFTGPAHARTLALRIHSQSGWRWGAFMAVDCGAAEASLEQQLFGVLEADLSPGATAAPAPRLRQAGTLFLHEVGRLGAASQHRLRDLLESARTGHARGRARRRIMASTSEPLLPRVLDGSFDDRLFYRLNMIHFVVRP
jgi:two-component system response regulator HydG